MFFCQTIIYKKKQFNYTIIIFDFYQNIYLNFFFSFFI